MEKIAFVRKHSIPPSAPPITEVGAIGWLKQNLFSSWLNSILTILSLYLIVIMLWDFIPWAYGGHWNTKSLRECLDLDPDVACFSVLAARWKQLLFGLYPAEEYWRPTLTFVCLVLAIVPILFPRFFKFFWFSVIFFLSFLVTTLVFFVFPLSLLFVFVSYLVLLSATFGL